MPPLCVPCQSNWGLLGTADSACQSQWNRQTVVDSACQSSWNKLTYVDAACEIDWDKTDAIDLACEIEWDATTECDTACEIEWTQATKADSLCEIDWDKTVYVDTLCEVDWTKGSTQDVVCDSDWDKTIFLDVACDSDWDKVASLDISCDSDWDKGNILDVVCDAEFEEEIILPCHRVSCQSEWQNEMSYIMIAQNIQFFRLSDSQEVLIEDCSISIDRESWAWRFQATVASRTDLNYIRPNSGPVPCELRINGYAWTLIVEEVSEDYSYDQGGRYTCTGTSLSVELAKPYCPLLTGTLAANTTLQAMVNSFVNTGGFAWNQLYCPAPGQPAVNPAIQTGRYSWTDMSRMDIALDIAKSYGGFVMTQGGFVMNTAIIAGHWHLESFIPPAIPNQRLLFNYRYPNSPTQWSLMPIVETIMQSEILSQSVRWEAVAEYSEVYCHGEEYGVVTRVYRIPGNISAPALSHRLIQFQNIAGQAGRNFLDENQYHKAIHTIVTPLPTYTNPQTTRPILLVPGCLISVIDYNDTFRGLVTGVTIEARRAETTQTLVVERIFVS
jgi:hypothetical protein